MSQASNPLNFNKDGRWGILSVEAAMGSKGYSSLLVLLQICHTRLKVSRSLVTEQSRFLHVWCGR